MRVYGTSLFCSSVKGFSIFAQILLHMSLPLILLALFYVFAPMGVLHLCHKYPFVNKLGAVLIAYAAGLLLGALPIMPEGHGKLQELIMTISIPLAIPLLLFSSNFRQWSALAGKSLLSMVLAVISVVVTVTIGYYLFRDTNPQLWKVSGMLVGVYTGGTPNLASLKLMLDVDENTYILTHTYDMVISAAYFFLLIFGGRQVFRLILPAFRLSGQGSNHLMEEAAEDPYWGILQPGMRRPLLTGLAISLGIFGLAGGVSLLVPESLMMVTVILLITSLGIAASFVGRIRQIEKTFELGMYLILIFSLTVSSMVNVNEMLKASPQLIYYISLVIFGSLLLHVLLAAIFRIDTDTVMITSTALICSPPFVPVIAGALKNREIIVPGLTVGIIGYAIGNYLGYIVANFLHAYGG